MVANASASERPPHYSMAEWTNDKGEKKHHKGGMLGALTGLMHTKSFGAKRRARHKNAQRKRIWRKAGGSGVFFALFFILSPTLVLADSPAFSATKSSDQTYSSANDFLITWQVEDFDTTGDFSSSRFTPSVAGKYFVGMTLDCINTSGVGCIPTIFKNGAFYQNGNYFDTTAETIKSVYAIVDMNGSTDYVEAYVGAISGTGTVYQENFTITRFSGSLIGAGGTTTTTTSTTTASSLYAPTQQEFLFLFGLFLFVGSVPFWERVFSITRGAYSV